MPNYSYKVRVLAALDTHQAPGQPRAVALEDLETTFKEICDDNNIATPSAWKKRVQLTIDGLVSDGYLAASGENYKPTPPLRKAVADQKLRLNLPQANHDLKIFVPISKNLPWTAEQEGEEDNGGSTANAAPASGRRRSTRVSIVVPPREVTPSSESVPDTPASVSSVIRLSTPRSAPARRPKPRASDPGPRPAPASPSRRRSSMAGPSGASKPANRRRSTAARNNRRHTLAVNPTREPMSIPAGESNIIQFLPLRQALSARARRALRRNALSDEMNAIEAEEKAGRKKSREEIAKLRRDLENSTKRLEELERLLTAARHAPSEEPDAMYSPMPLPAVDEEEEEDVDMGGMGFDYGAGHEDDTPEPEHFPLPQAEDDVFGYGTHTPRPALSRQPSSIGDTPGSRKKDERIRQLEQEIANLREENRLQLEAIEAAEEEETYHDAQEQVLGDLNANLADRNERLEERVNELQHLRDERAAREAERAQQEALQTEKSVRFEEVEEIIEDVVEAEYVESSSPGPEDTTFNMPVSSGVDSGIGATQDSDVEMEVESVSDDKDERVLALETENEKLQEALENIRRKLDDMDEEAMDMRLQSGEDEQQIDLLRQERDNLQQQTDILKERIEELELIEGIRVKNVQSSGVQTALSPDEKEDLEERVDELLEEAQELQQMHDAIAKEKHQVEVTVAECNARIKALEAAVELGAQEKAAAEEIVKNLREIVVQLQGREKDLESEKKEMKAEIEDLCAKCEDLEKQLEGLRTENGELKAQATVKDATIAELSRELSAVGDRVANFNTEVDALRNRIAGLEAELIQKNIEMEGLVEENETLEANVEDINAEYLDAQAQLTARASEVELMKETLDTRENEIKTLSVNFTELEDVNKSLQDANESLQDEKAYYENKVYDIEQARDAAIDDNSDLQSTINELEARIESFENQLETADEAKRDFQSTIESLQFQIKALEQAKEGSQKDVQSYQRDISRLEAAVAGLEAKLTTSGKENEGLRNEIQGAKAQIASFVEAERSAAAVKEQLDNQVAGLSAQVEALHRASREADKETERLDAEIDKLTSEIDSLRAEVEALKSEKSLMQHDIETYKDKVSKLNQLLEVANRENEALTKIVADLKSHLASRESDLAASNQTNSGLIIEVDLLKQNIDALERVAEADREEKAIVLHKLRPYFQGELSLDMAIEEVITELVMARNHANEENHKRLQLEKKVKLLAQDADGIDPEEAVDQLADRFKDVRGRVEAAYLRYRQEKESPFGTQMLEDFAWTGKNEHALAKLGDIVEELAGRVVETRRAVREYKVISEAEQARADEMSGYLEDVVMAMGDENVPEKPKIASVVKGLILELNTRIASLDGQVEELFATIEGNKEAMHQMEVDLEEAAGRQGKLEKDVKSRDERIQTTEGHLKHARNEIDELNQTASKRSQEISRLEKEIRSRNAAEMALRQQLEEQVAMQKMALEQLNLKHQEAMDDMKDELNTAHDGIVDEFNQSLAERDADIKRLESVVTDSTAEINSLNNRLREVQAANEAAVGKLQQQLAESRADKHRLEQEFRQKVYDRDHIIEKLEIQLREARNEATRKIRELEEVNRNGEKVTAELAQELEMTSKAVVVHEEQLKKHRAEREAEKTKHAAMLLAINDQLDKFRTAAAIEKQRLEGKVADGEAEIQELREQEEELQKSLAETEAAAIELEGDLGNEKAAHQLDNEAAATARAALQSEKSALQSQLAAVEQAAASTESQLRADIMALRGLVDKKKSEIEGLAAAVSMLTSEKDAMATQLSELETENSALVDELEVERTKGSETAHSMYSEIQRIANRMGDIKNLHARETAARASASRTRKRTRSEVEVEEQLAMAPSPPSPPTTANSGARRHSAISAVGSSFGGLFRRGGAPGGKKRRYDSGIGCEDDEDEGFHGSLASGSMAG